MLDQLRRLVSSSDEAGSRIPPSGSRNVPVAQHQRSGSLNRLAAYSVHPHPQHFHHPPGRQQQQHHHHHHALRMQLSYVPPPPPPPQAVLAWNGRPVVLYAHQHHPPVMRQSSGQVRSKIRPESIYSSEAFFGKQRLVPSRSLDSIHPHRISPSKPSGQALAAAAAAAGNNNNVKSAPTSNRVKDFFQRVRQSVKNASLKAPSPDRSAPISSAEWLLLRPSAVASPPTGSSNGPHRPSTPGLAAIRKIFTRSSPAATPRPSSPGPSSEKLPPPPPPPVQDVIRRGDPDGATFPRCEASVTETNPPPEGKPSRPPRPPPPAPQPAATAGKDQRKKAPDPVFRVRRRGSQLRRSDRKRRSLRRSGRKKGAAAKKASNKLAGMAGSRISLTGLNSQSSLSGAKLVSDWTYLPLPSSLNRPPEEGSLERQAEEASGWEADLYQVLAEAGPCKQRRNLPHPPMWDPLIFIPPERRTARSGNHLELNQQPWIRASKIKAEVARKSRRSAQSGSLTGNKRNEELLLLLLGPGCPFKGPLADV